MNYQLVTGNFFELSSFEANCRNMLLNGFKPAGGVAVEYGPDGVVYLVQAFVSGVPA